MDTMRVIFTFLFLCQFLTAQETNGFATLKKALLSETPLEEDLQQLCDEIGGRVTGSEANKLAVEWAYNKFLDAGLAVEKEAFDMPSLWLDNGTSLTVSYNDQSFSPIAVSKYQSPAGNFEGEIIPVEEVSDSIFSHFSELIENNFVLVPNDLCLDINGLFTEYNVAKAAEDLAYKYGAQGIIFMSSRPKGLLYRFITSKGVDNDMRQFVMSREDAQRCIRLIEQGFALDLSGNIEAIEGEAFTSHNVIAEIKGTTRPEEIVLIGAHLDSWALGTGANDNGCNVSMMIDIARQMKLHNIQPERTIRFALWNGEEQGYFGSWNYTLDHKDELDKHKMTLSVDIGSGPIIGFFANGRKDLIPIIDKVLTPVSELGPYLNINNAIIGTDNFDFLLQGVPNLVANHKPALYGPNYHASSDTYDKVDLVALKNNSAVIAALSLGFANNDFGLRRQNRAEVQSIMDDQKLEFPMRMFNVWEPWVKKERGLK
jgi:hypothetical protein